MVTYRVTDPDYRVITNIGQGADTHSMICEAMALEVDCDPDDLTFHEEFDRNDDPTGEELIKLDGAIVGRVFQARW